MSRLRYFGVIVSVTLLTAPLVAQNSAMVRHVAVRGTGEVIEVEIQTSGAPVSPDTQAITGPDRIVVDFPGALPSSELRALKVNRGALKGIRSGLFFNNPPITRVVLDLVEPQSYQIATSGNTTVVKLGPAAAAGNQDASARPVAGARLQQASLASGANAPAVRLSAFGSRPLEAATQESQNSESQSLTAERREANATPQPLVPLPVDATPEPPRPALTVTYENGMLSIHAEKATLAQVLFETQQQTHAEIAIPAGAEQEQVVADLGPGPARDVLGELLNGSAYNFVFVGEELSLERVILTRRDPGGN